MMCKLTHKHSRTHARTQPIIPSKAIYGPRHEKTCLRGFANNTGADQPARPRSPISAFFIRLLESIISRLATIEISIFWLVTVAEETGLKFAFSDTPKTGFPATRLNYYVKSPDQILRSFLSTALSGCSTNPRIGRGEMWEMFPEILVVARKLQAFETM